MKKINLLFLLTILPMTASAYDAQVDGIYYNIDAASKTAEVTCLSNKRNENASAYSGVVSIPEEVAYQGVTYSVTTIGQGAFTNCKELTSVTIPESITTICQSAFLHCSGLTSITIPGSVSTIMSSAFADCSGLTSITIPKSVTSIGQNALAGCIGLKSMAVENGNPVYDSRGNCNAIIETASNTLACGSPHTVIPNSVTSIGVAAFNQCSNMASIDIPNSVTTIGERAFMGCKGLTSLTIPESVTTIGEWAFLECSGLTAVHITDLKAWCKTSFGNNPLEYAHHLFLNGEEITELVVPKRMTYISDRAFIGCDLTSVTIPVNVAYIGKSAFASCKKLTTVTCESKNIPQTSEDAFIDTKIGINGTLYVPSSAYNSYMETAPWKKFRKVMAISHVKLTYMVNGSVYKLYHKEAGEAITPETAPTKVGCTFSGWSSIPTFMPNEDVVVSGTLTEDVYGICSAPTVSYENGEITFSSETEGAEFHYTITDSDIHNNIADKVALTKSYTISVYAAKPGYENSDEVTATLYWIDVEQDTGGIMPQGGEVKTTPVLITSNGGVLTLTGVPEGTDISVYDLSGQKVGSATATTGATHVSTTLGSGTVAIVKVGGKSLKVTIR